jgi:hypothetical protein
MSFFIDAFVVGADTSDAIAFEKKLRSMPKSRKKPFIFSPRKANSSFPLHHRLCAITATTSSR